MTELGDPAATDIRQVPGAIELEVSKPGTFAGECTAADECALALASFAMPRVSTYVGEWDFSVTPGADIKFGLQLWSMRGQLYYLNVSTVGPDGGEGIVFLGCDAPGCSPDSVMHQEVTVDGLQSGRVFTVAVVLQEKTLTLFLDQDQVARVDAPVTVTGLSSPQLTVSGPNEIPGKGLAKVLGARFYQLPATAATATLGALTPAPTAAATAAATAVPAPATTTPATAPPTPVGTVAPTAAPTQVQTAAPTVAPTPVQTTAPTAAPTPSSYGLGQPAVLSWNFDGESEIVITVYEMVDPAEPSEDVYVDPADRLVAFRVRIQNNGPSVYDEYPANLAEVIDTQGRQYEADASDPVAPGFDALRIGPGVAIEGYISFELPKTVQVKQLQYTASFFDADTARWTVR